MTIEGVVSHQTKQKGVTYGPHKPSAPCKKFFFPFHMLFVALTALLSTYCVHVGHGLSVEKQAVTKMDRVPGPRGVVGTEVINILFVNI